MRRKTVGNMASELPVLSVFSGIGGLDLGLEHAGFGSCGYLEIDEVARRSLHANRPGWVELTPNEVNAASESLRPSDLGLRRRELPLLAGAPPCQPFSMAAQWSHLARRGVHDERSDCLQGFFRLVDTFLPRVILMENVQGFASGRTSALHLIKRHLRRINRRNRVSYRLQCWIVDAADYGVPQRRRRAILIAERSGKAFQIPTATHAQAPVTAWEALSDLPSVSRDANDENSWLELLPSIPEGQNYLWHTRRGGGEPLFAYRSRFWSFLLKLAKNRPSWTLSAQPGPYAGPFHWTSRRLTATEMLRLQSFPSQWIVEGTTREQIKQIGNATPPVLAECIGRALIRQFFGVESHAECQLTVDRQRAPCPAPERVAPVPRKYLKMRGTWPDHPGTGLGPKPVSEGR